MGSSRRHSRELALQVLFQREFSEDMTADSSLSHFQRSFEAPDEVWEYAKLLLTGTIEHKNEIDQMISSCANNWDIKRMALVDLNIMRIASFELKHLQSEIPPKVAINEAVEISKKYGNKESSQFINGILAQILKEVE